jgi:hypothetical protein
MSGEAEHMLMPQAQKCETSTSQYIDSDRFYSGPHLGRPRVVWPDQEVDFSVARLLRGHYRPKAKFLDNDHLSSLYQRTQTSAEDDNRAG